MPKFDVSSVGFSVLDILGRPVTRIPEGGRADFIEEITMTVAGTAAATAVACAILGLKTQIVTTVGEDDLGDYMIAKMERFGVDCGMVRRDGSVQTSATMLPVRPNGERPALHVPGTATVFSVADEDLDAATDAGIVHLGGTGLLKAFDGARSVAFVRHAKALNRTVTLDLIQATPETAALITPLLPHVDYFVPSIEEASELAGRSDPAEVARWCHDAGAQNVILTLGEDGAFVSPKDATAFRLPSHAIDVVDTTGCGDCFSAGLVVGLTKGWGIERSARFASAVAARVAMGLGSVGQLTSFDDTMTIMESWPLRD